MNTRIYSPSRRGFLKGLAVGAGGYALGSLLIHPEEALGQSIEGYLKKVPMEARWNRNSPQVFVWAPSGNSFSSSTPEGQRAEC